MNKRPYSVSRRFINTISTTSIKNYFNFGNNNLVEFVIKYYFYEAKYMPTIYQK